MDDVDDSKYFTPKAFIFDSGLPFGLLELIIIILIVAAMIGAWYVMHRQKMLYASRVDLEGHFPRRRRRRRARR